MDPAREGIQRGHHGRAGCTDAGYGQGIRVSDLRDVGVSSTVRENDIFPDFDREFDVVGREIRSVVPFSRRAADETSRKDHRD